MRWQYKYFKELIRMKKKGLLTNQCKLYLISQQNNVVLKIAEAGFMVDSIAKLHNITSYNLSQVYTSTMLLDSLYLAGQYGTSLWERAWTDYQAKYSVFQTSIEIETLRDSVMSDSTRNVLNNISVVDSCLKVLVNIYKIRLNLLNGDTLQTAEKDWLRPIALACPDQIGEGVYMARSLLSVYETDHEYPEMHQCFVGEIKTREGENTLSASDKLIVFPNPANDEVNILINKGDMETGNISISDINGRIIGNYDLSEHENTLKLKSSNWSEGVYIVKYLSADGDKRIVKVVVTK